MGKTNGRMPKSRENIEDELNNISPAIFSALNDEIDAIRHAHEWTFLEEIKEYDEWDRTTERFSKYACHCGAVKRVKQFEVEG